MNDITLKAENITKYFIKNRYIFRDINLEVKNGEILAVSGENGSGKSTLLKILSGMLKPSYGKVNYLSAGNQVKTELIRERISYVAPYMFLYEEFTPEELIQIFTRITGENFNIEKSDKLLKKFNLYLRKYEPIRTFSSGMKQRMKFVLAFMKKSETLFLDEPLTNLDSEGISIVLDSVFEFQKEGGAVILASNESRDRAIAGKEIVLS